MKKFKRLIERSDHLDKLFIELSSLLDENKFSVIVSDVIDTRTLAQNKLMWLWIAGIKKHFLNHFGRTYDDDAIHEYIKKLFLEPVVYVFKDEIIKKYSTKHLTTKEFTEYLKKIDYYAADTLDLILPHPEDIFNRAMGRFGCLYIAKHFNCKNIG